MDPQAPTAESKSVLDPKKIVHFLGLKNGDYVADFGSGHGYFIIPLAKSVSPDGKVFAIDIQRQMLDITRAKSKLENLLNVECIWSDLENPQGSKLKDDFVDLVLLTNILHQSDQKENIIKEAYRILRANGRLAVIEWDVETPTDSFGPPHAMRIGKEAVINLCTGQSFLVAQEFDAGSHHYGILFVKK